MVNNRGNQPTVSDLQKGRDSRKNKTVVLRSHDYSLQSRCHGNS